MGTEREVNDYDEMPVGVNTTCRNKMIEMPCNSNGDDYGPTTGLPIALPATTTIENCTQSVPVCINENNVIEGARTILTVIRPHWNLDFVKFKKFTDGITNKLVGCFYYPPAGYDIADDKITQINGSINDATCCIRSDCNLTMSKAENHANVVLIRVYGNKTDLLIDREKEICNIKLLQRHGFAPRLYATFQNGLAYEFLPGVTLSPDNVLKTSMWSLVARRMAEMHRLVQPLTPTTVEMVEPMLLKKMELFLKLVPERYHDETKQKRLEDTFLPITRMRQEFAQLYEHLQNLKSPIVFSHNDLLLGNIIYTEAEEKVTFIDYEYADYNFQAFDIGNHFAEFAGVETVDYNRYPSREFQLEWLRLYLETYLQTSEISKAQLERLYVQVNQFALAAHLFWTTWSLVQAEYSNIDFDYVEYAFVRYNEYLAKKDAFLSLDYKY